MSLRLKRFGPKANKTLLCVAALVAATALLWVYASFDPSTHFFPRCIFKSLTGWDCPGCGSQRAIHALLHGRVGEALAYNALFVIELPLIALLAASPLLRTRWPRLYRMLGSRPFILGLFAVIVAYSVARNLW